MHATILIWDDDQPSGSTESPIPPGYVRAAGSVQAHVQAVLYVETQERLVVGGRRLQLAFRKQADKRCDLAVGESPHSREMLVDQVVDPKVFLSQVRAVFSTVVVFPEEDFDLACRNLAPEREHVARNSERLVDEPGSLRPAGIVEDGFAARGHGALECSQLGHFTRPLSAAWHRGPQVRDRSHVKHDDGRWQMRARLVRVRRRPQPLCSPWLPGHSEEHAKAMTIIRGAASPATLHQLRYTKPSRSTLPLHPSIGGYWAGFLALAHHCTSPVFWNLFLHAPPIRSRRS